MGERKPGSSVWPPPLREKATCSPPLFFQVWFNTCTNLVMAKEEKESQDYWNQRIGSCHAGFREGATGFGTSLDRWQGWSGTSVLGRAPVKVCRSQLIRDGIWEFEMGVTVQWLRRIKTPKIDLLNELYSVTETGFVAWWRGENVRSFWNPSVLEFSWLSGLMSGQRHRMALASSTSW